MGSDPWAEVPVLVWPPSAQERALVAELAALDRELEAAGGLDRGGDDPDPGPGTLVDDVELIDAILERGPDPWSVSVLMGIDPDTLLDPIDRVRYLQAVDLVSAYVAARQQRALVAVAGSRSSGDLWVERHVEHEVAMARRSTRGRAGRDIEVARALGGEFHATSAALQRGQIGVEHATALVRGTRLVADPGRRAQVEARVLPAAASMSPTAFGRAVAAAVCAIDAEDETARHARARAQRHVRLRRCEHGLGELTVLDEWSRLSALYDRITTAGKHLQDQRHRTAIAEQGATGVAAPDEEWWDRTLDNCRADALADLMLTDDTDDDRGRLVRRRGSPVRRRGRPRLEGRLVIDLVTLRGEADHPCLLDGSPVPAQFGRRLARDIDHWRRMVTDPVHGHLLDFGRRVYLPDSLRAFVLERDQVCRNPWCDQPAMRGQLDHAVEFPDGPSDTANTGALCVDCHRLKTARLAFLDRSAADGSVIWRTAWGQTVRVAPRPVLPTASTVPGVLDRHADMPPATRPRAPPDTDDIPPF